MASRIIPYGKIPYGISNYEKIKEERYAYVDKTRFIEVLEKLSTNYPVFLRPRRFGKSLLVSTLQNYYDKSKENRFEELFGDTYIGGHKTALANSYYVMRFDFSKLDAESEETLKKSFYRTVLVRLEDFQMKYGLNISIKESDDYNSADLLDDFLIKVNRIIGRKLYIMIDEYDHFANAILSNRQVFHKITSKEGFVRSFYEVFKAHTNDSCIDRIFITGVTSLTYDTLVALDSLTSGFNIAQNVSMYPELNEMTGFTSEETKTLFKELEVNNEVSPSHQCLKERVEETMEILTESYNGYLFHQNAENKVFNSNMVLYFMDAYQREKAIPRKLTDPNMRSDYHKLTTMFDLFENEEAKQHVLEKIMNNENLETDIITNFNFAEPFEEEEFLSLLFYLGLLTIKKEGHAFDVSLQTPNAVIRDIYYQYYANYLNLTTREKRTAIANIALNNDFKELNRLVSDILKLHSNDDYRGFDESRLKSVFLSCFSDQNLFLVKSEYTSEGKKIDIALFDRYGRSKDIKYNYLIELKYLKKMQARHAQAGHTQAGHAQAGLKRHDPDRSVQGGPGPEAMETVRDSAVRQMKEYLSLKEFRDNPKIKGLIYVVVKDEIVYFEEVKR